MKRAIAGAQEIEEYPAASCRESPTVRNSIYFLIRSLTPQQAMGNAPAVAVQGNLVHLSGLFFIPHFIMKNVLILGDIHANYPALKAIQNYVQPNRFDRVVNTGDITVYSTFPNETIQWFRERNNSLCILGNTDKRVLRILKGKKLKKPRKREKRVMYFWTSEKLLPENVEFLKSLPKHSDFKIDNIHIGVFHGTFDDENETLFPGTPESRFRKLAKDSPFQVHILGHSHVPYYKIVSGVHFVNPGSVGRMFDGDPRTSFAILKVSSERIKIEHFRIPYPVEEVIKGLKKNHLPDIYTKMYRKGKKLN